jgi:hypothetical protein
MNPLSGHATSGASTVQNAPADLEAAYNFQDTYLQPLRIFDSVVGTLADVRDIPIDWDRTNYSVGASICEDCTGRAVLCIKSMFRLSFGSISC